MLTRRTAAVVFLLLLIPLVAMLMRPRRSSDEAPPLNRTVNADPIASEEPPGLPHGPEEVAEQPASEVEFSITKANAGFAQAVRKPAKRIGRYFLEPSSTQRTGEPSFSKEEAAVILARLRTSSTVAVADLDSPPSEDVNAALHSLFTMLSSTAQLREGAFILGGRLGEVLFYRASASSDAYAVAFWALLRAAYRNASSITKVELDLPSSASVLQSSPPKWMRDLFRTHVPKFDEIADEIDASLGINQDTPFSSALFDEALDLRYELWGFEYEEMFGSLHNQLSESESYLLWRLLEIFHIPPPWP